MCMKHFVIYANSYKDKGLAVTERVRRYLLDRGQECSLVLIGGGQSGSFVANHASGGESASDDRLGGQKPGEAVIPDGTSCVIVLGGDGTMLQAAGEVSPNVPLAGVNLGNLGYMAEIEPSGLEEALDRLISGDYEVESRMMLQGQVLSRGQELSHGQNLVQDQSVALGEETSPCCALNDIVLSRRGPLQILEFNIYVNGQFLHDYHADGVIVTTATGSTGYNLSAGGPIVEPRAELMMLTPICPHSLNHRSIVLSPEDEILIEIPAGRDGGEQVMEVSFDGGHGIELHTGDRLRIVRAGRTVKFVRLNQVSFLEVLHRKLSES